MTEIGTLCGFVDRGDASAWDFQLSDLITDGSYHDLDLSSIIPKDAKGVLIQIYLLDDAASSVFIIKNKGHSGWANAADARTQVANVAFEYSLIVSPDKDGKIQYAASNTTWSNISLFVRGWWI